MLSLSHSLAPGYQAVPNPFFYAIKSWLREEEDGAAAASAAAAAAYAASAASTARFTARHPQQQLLTADMIRHTM